MMKSETNLEERKYKRAVARISMFSIFLTAGIIYGVVILPKAIAIMFMVAYMIGVSGGILYIFGTEIEQTQEKDTYTFTLYDLYGLKSITFAFMFPINVMMMKEILDIKRGADGFMSIFFIIEMEEFESDVRKRYM